jgi:hypothetical protein
MRVLLALLTVPVLSALVSCGLSRTLTERDLAVYERHALNSLSDSIVQDWLKTKPTVIDAVCLNLADKSRRDCIVAIRAYIATELAKIPEGRAAIHKLVTLYLQHDGWQRSGESEKATLSGSLNLVGPISHQGYETGLSRPFGLRYGYLGPATPNAYGPGIHSDATGRPFMWQPQFGGLGFPDPTLQVQPNAYGLGVGMDQYGRPVRPSCPPGTMC